MQQPVSATPIDDQPQKPLSSARKLVLLLTFCFAQFLDAFNNAALYPAIPVLRASIRAEGSEFSWVISVFQLTFASFLLISGRLSDVYSPRGVFVTGMALLGILSISAGFINSKVVMIVLRALMGIASAMSIPSALALLVHIFPEPDEQARAIAVLGGFGAVADVLGLLVGAVLVQYVSYHWIFWFAAIIAIPTALCCLCIVPADVAESDLKSESDMGSAKWKNLDLIGISILTGAFILLLYAMTSGPTYGWTTAKVLILFITSISLAIAFFYWETLVPCEKAAIPPRTWFYRNFSVLFASALLPFFWWNSVFLAFTTLWQDTFHWTIISTVFHMLPMGVAAFAMSFAGPLSRIISSKWIILAGLFLVSVATAFVATGGSRPEDYWPHIFPAIVIGSAGTMLVYTHTNIAIFQAAPAHMAGTVGAIFNSALQFGSAIGLAAFASIETSVGDTHGDSPGYGGRAAAFWFLLAIVLIEFISVFYFYHAETSAQPALDTNIAGVPVGKSKEVEGATAFDGNEVLSEFHVEVKRGAEGEVASMSPGS